MPPIRFVLICLIPTIVMVECGSRMLANIRQAKKRVAPQKSVQHIVIALVVIPVSKRSNIIDENRPQTAAIDQMLFLMVLANIITYIITQIPFNIYTLYYPYEISVDYTLYSLIRAFLLIWSSVYFGIGFYLFCITSPQFRKQFITKIKTLFICYREITFDNTLRAY
jgi:hypothetical protein